MSITIWTWAMITPVVSLGHLSLPIRIAPEINQNCSALPPLNETAQQIFDYIADYYTTTTENMNIHKHPSCSCAGNGSWTRVAYLDMSNTTFQCPSNWKLLETPVRGCQSKFSYGCDSATFTTSGFTYNKVCGKIIGYQEGSTNAFSPYIYNSKTIEQEYVDGLSLTHGPPGFRKHIWTFAAALGEDVSVNFLSYYCACTNATYPWPFSTPSFMKNNYFCDTGNSGPRYKHGLIYSNNSLWDGRECGPHSSSCQFNNPPWFCTSLPEPTTDDLELRICIDESPSYENIIISSVEIYISYN